MRFIENIRGVCVLRSSTLLFALVVAPASSATPPAAARVVLQEVWRQPLPAGGPAPVVARQFEVAVAAAEALIRIDATDGRVLSTVGFDAAIVEVRADDRGIYAITDASSLAWLSPDAVLIATTCLPAATVGVAIDDRWLVIALDDASVLAFSLDDHQLAWRSMLDSVARAAPALSRELVAVPTANGLQFLRAQGGERVGSSKPELSTELAPAAIWDRFVVSSRDHRIAAVKAPGGGSSWRTEIGGGASAPPIANADRVYIASVGNQLLALKANGSPAWRASLDGRVTYPPTIWDSHVLVVPFRRPTLAGFDLTRGNSSVRGQLNGSQTVFESAAVTTGPIVTVRGRDGDRRFLVGFAFERTEPAPSRDLPTRGRGRGPRTPSGDNSLLY